MRTNSLLCALLLPLMLLGCAAPCPPVLPAVVPPPQIPPPPVTTAPAPPGSYWGKVCNYRQSLQQRLSVKLTAIEPCVRLGLEE